MNARMKSQLGRIVCTCIFLLSLTGLFAQFGGGNGTPADPYQIATPEHLNNIRDYLSSNFIQTADIDLNVPPYNTGGGWVPIGGNDPNQFSGSFNGNGYVIANMYINRPVSTQQGFFGKALSAVFVNILFTNVNITGQYRIGALVGECFDSNISNCSVDGVVAGYSFVGGLVSRGFNNNINNCLSSASVSGGIDLVGGIIGSDNYGTVSNCYATGSVTGVNNVGGLVGSEWEATTINSYSTGHVTGTGSYVGGLIGKQTESTSTNCYWNTQTSGQTTSAGGSGRTTDEMTYPYAANTYVGWNFTTIWGSEDSGTTNNGYPFLRSLTEAVAAPDFIPEGGIYPVSSLEVLVLSPTPNAVIRYTLDGSEPNPQSPVCDISITLDLSNGPVTVKAKGYKSGWLPSDSSTATYETNVSAEDETEIPSLAGLVQVYPNPFSQSTSLGFKLTSDTKVNLAIYNLKGQPIRTLTDELYHKGDYELTWDGKDSNGNPCPAGVYFCRIKAGMACSLQKMLLLK